MAQGKQRSRGRGSKGKIWVTNEPAIESSVVSMRSRWGRRGISVAWLLRCGSKGDGREGAGTRWRAEGKAAGALGHNLYCFEVQIFLLLPFFFFLTLPHPIHFF